MSDRFEILTGDCLEVMRTLPPSSIDAIVTDPPYGLSFMGKRWDYDVPRVEVWEQCFRVLKPGGHLLAFAGTRTHHRMAVRIEDGGFEIRDMIAWVYGSGFPKSLDVSKAIDKAGGGKEMPENDRKAFAAELRNKRELAGITRQVFASWFPQYLEVTKNWERQDEGFRIPSEKDYQILVDRLGISESWRSRVRAEDKRRLVAEDLQDRRGDETVIGLGHSGKEWESTTDAARQWSGFGTALKPAMEPITVARKPLDGTVTGNVLKYRTGALNIDGCRVGATDDDYQKNCSGDRGHAGTRSADSIGVTDIKSGGGSANKLGRWPANFIHDGSDEVIRLFPHSSGQNGATGPKYGDRASVNAYGDYGPRPEFEPRRDKGSAARFFYCAKASKADRNEGLVGIPPGVVARSNQAKKQAESGKVIEAGSGAFNKARYAQNNHPTVKPTELMRYLCRLITPPGGLILDPFVGSGSTGKAAMLEGFQFIGIERETSYAEIARLRIEHAAKKSNPQPFLF